MTTTDEDLRLVAEAVGLKRVEITNLKDEPVGHQWVASRPDGKHVFWDSPHPLAPNLSNDDGLAAKFLLPWLQRKVAGGRGIAWLNLRFDHDDQGWMAYYERDFLGEIDEIAVGDGDSLAEALFDLCLRIIKENPT